MILFLVLFIILALFAIPPGTGIQAHLVCDQCSRPALIWSADGTQLCSDCAVEVQEP